MLWQWELRKLDTTAGLGQDFPPILIHQTSASTSISIIEGRAWNISYARYCASIHRAGDWRGQKPHNFPAFQHGIVPATRLLIWRPCTGDTHIWGQQGHTFDPCIFTRLDYHTSNIVRLLYLATDRCSASPSKRHLGS